MPRARTIVSILSLTIGLALSAWCQQPDAGRGLSRLKPAKSPMSGPLYTGSHALVIGVEDYTGTWRALSGVSGEADMVAKTLTDLDFSVTKVLNPTGEKLHAEFRKFVDAHGYEPGFRLFVFFAGHAHVRSDGRSYLVPADAPDPTEKPKEFLRVALAMTQVMAWARTMEANHVLFALDCDIGDAVFGTRSQAPSPAVLDNASRPVRQFVVAGQPGTLGQKRGAFATALAAGIGGRADVNADGFVTGTELGMYLREETQRRGGALALFGKIRDPDLDEGDFCFRVAGSAGASEQSQLRAQVEALREQRRRLEAEARSIAASRQQDAEWESLELALEILQEADRKAATISSRTVTKEGEMLAEILSQAASRALVGGDVAGASALATQAAAINPGGAGVVELVEAVRSHVSRSRIKIRRATAMKELDLARKLALPKDVQPSVAHIDNIIARYLTNVDTQDSTNAEYWYRSITWRARGLRAVGAGQGTAMFAEVELLGPLVAHASGPAFDLHVGNLTPRSLTVDMAGAMRTLCVVLTGPLPQRRTFVLPEPFYAQKNWGGAKVFKPNECTRYVGRLISPDKLPTDFFPSRDYAVPPPGMYEMQVRVAFPEEAGAWSGVYQSVPLTVQVWSAEQLAAKMKAR